MKSSTKNPVQDDSDEEEDEEELFVMRGQASPRTPETLKDEALSFMGGSRKSTICLLRKRVPLIVKDSQS